MDERNCTCKRIFVVQKRSGAPDSEWRDCSKAIDTWESLDKVISSGIVSGPYNIRGFHYRVIVRYVVSIDNGILDNDYCWTGVGSGGAE